MDKELQVLNRAKPFDIVRLRRSISLTMDPPLLHTQKHAPLLLKFLVVLFLSCFPLIFMFDVSCFLSYVKGC